MLRSDTLIIQPLVVHESMLLLLQFICYLFLVRVYFFSCSLLRMENCKTYFQIANCTAAYLHTYLYFIIQFTYLFNYTIVVAVVFDYFVTFVLNQLKYFRIRMKHFLWFRQIQYANIYTNKPAPKLILEEVFFDSFLKLASIKWRLHNFFLYLLLRQIKTVYHLQYSKCMYTHSQTSTQREKNT